MLSFPTIWDYITKSSHFRSFTQKTFSTSPDKYTKSSHKLIIGLFWCFRTGHGPVGLAHVLLSEDEADQADAAVHQPHQETRHGEDLIAGCEGGHVTKDHLKKQTWKKEKQRNGRKTDEESLKGSLVFSWMHLSCLCMQRGAKLNSTAGTCVSSTAAPLKHSKSLQHAKPQRKHEHTQPWDRKGDDSTTHTATRSKLGKIPGRFSDKYWV